MSRPAILLRKQNRIRSIQSSLSIEGNTLSVEQVSDLIENRIVIGPKKDILEVKNAIRAYESLGKYHPQSIKSFLQAHGILMEGLIEGAGKFRNTQVGVYSGNRVVHLAPPPGNVSRLMEDLFGYLKTGEEPALIKSCVFHYECEFIHPFADGNGRMGRLWQTAVLMKEHPVFEFVPFESCIRKRQDEYYKVLAQCGKEGESTKFIEYMLAIIDETLDEMLDVNNANLVQEERLEYFSWLGQREFTRKDYMDVFKTISGATASRDLRKGVADGLFLKTGDKNSTVYSMSRKKIKPN